MFCKNCGKKSEGTHKFCTNCGVAFSNTQNANSIPVSPADGSSVVKDTWTTKKILKFAAGVIIAGVLIFYRIQNAVDSPAVDKNNSAQEAYQEGGDPDQAISQLQQASQEAVTDSTKMTTTVNLAYVYASEGKNDLALSAFKEALPLASEGSLDYHLISGEIALLEGKPDLALIAYNKAYAKNPNDFQINNALNLFYLDIGDEWPHYSDVSKALPYAIKAHEAQPSGITKQNLAIAYYLNENYAQSISLLSSIPDISKQPYLAFWLGLSYIGDEQWVNAKDYLQIAIDGGVDVPQEIRDYVNNN
ncbi:MAG: tetratricopeptide repeat protein [Patescibacteria group bacterium]